MRRAFLVFCLFITTSGCSLFNVKGTHEAPTVRDVPYGARSAEGDLRKRLFILPFIDGTPRKSDATAQAARNGFMHTLGHSTDSLVVVSLSDFPGDLSRLRNEQEFDLAAVSKNVASLGVAAIVEGKVLEVRVKRLSDEVGLMRSVRAQVEASVRLRVWGVRNDKELLNEIRQAKVESSTTRFAKQSNTDRELEEDPKLIEEVVVKAFQGATLEISRAIQRISWEGRVAMVKGEKIYLNAGRLSGLQVGDLLRVVGEAEEIFDPETGALLGKVPGSLKGTVEIVSYFGQDGAVAVVHSGAGFKENDRVEMY
jgi:hypothetical protein